MNDFLVKSKKFFSDVNQLKNYTTTFVHLGAQKNSGILDKKTEELVNNKMEAINNKFRALSNDLKNRLDEVTSELPEENTRMNFEYKTKKVHVHSQTKALTSAINEYRDAQYRYKKEEEEKFKLQFYIANPSADESEIRECIAEDHGEVMLASAFALGSHSAQGILDEAKSRKTNIKKIANTIQELIEMLNVLNNAIYNQHDVVDNIEQDLTTAHENTAAANIDLEAALDYQIRATRLKRILIGIVVIVIIVVIAFVVIKIAISSGVNYENTNNIYFNLF